jgi:nucleoid DNA-binding protein
MNISKKDFLNAMGTEISTNLFTVAQKKGIEEVLDALAKVSESFLKNGDTITIPDIVRLKIVKKEATEAREGISPFTKKKVQVPAKPASRKIKASVVKALKDKIS